MCRFYVQFSRGFVAVAPLSDAVPTNRTADAVIEIPALLKVAGAGLDWRLAIFPEQAEVCYTVLNNMLLEAYTARVAV